MLVFFVFAISGYLGYIYRRRLFNASLTALWNTAITSIKCYTVLIKMVNNLRREPLQKMSVYKTNNGNIVEYILYDQRGGSIDIVFVEPLNPTPTAIIYKLIEKHRSNAKQIVSCYVHEKGNEDAIVIDATKHLKKFFIHFTQANTCALSIFIEYLERVYGVDIKGHVLCIYKNDHLFSDVRFDIGENLNTTIHDMLVN